MENIQTNEKKMEPVQVGEYKECDGNYAPLVCELISKAAISHKQEVLRFMKETPSPSIIFKSGFNDPVTGKFIAGPPKYYEIPDGKYSWHEEAMHYFEKYNLKLPDEFIEYVLEKVSVK